MTSHAAMLPRYQHLRQVALQLNNRLVKLLPKEVLNEGGKKLGILKGNTLVLDTEDMICVLMDYCIYNVRRQGLNAIEQLLAKSPPPPDSDEMVVLKGMKEARYSIFMVEAVERGAASQSGINSAMKFSSSWMSILASQPRSAFSWPVGSWLPTESA